MHNHTNIYKTDCSVLYAAQTDIDDAYQSSLHTHTNLELLLITDGEGTIVADKKFQVKKRDLVIINPNARHYEVGKGLCFFVIGINNRNVFLKDSYQNQIIIQHLNDENYQEVKSMVEIIYKEAFRRGNNSLKIINNEVNNLSFYLNDLYYLKVTKYNGKSSELVENIKNIITDYYVGEIKLDDLASRLSTSKATICHRFKKETGKSIIEYKIERQIEEAVGLLKMSDMSITQIATFVGFNSDAYFIMKFKQIKGMTPREFQKQYRQSK